MSQVETNPTTLYMHTSEVSRKGFDFGPLLPDGITLTGTPTIVITPSSGLAAASIAVNTGEFADADNARLPIAANEGVTAMFTASTAGTYTLVITCGTSDSQTLPVNSTIVVEA